MTDISDDLGTVLTVTMRGRGHDEKMLARDDLISSRVNFRTESGVWGSSSVLATGGGDCVEIEDKGA